MGADDSDDHRFLTIASFCGLLFFFHARNEFPGLQLIVVW